MDAIAVVSDTHVGSHFGLCPPEGLRLDTGKYESQNKFQETTWRFWMDCWNEWLPSQTRKVKRRILVHNGDIIEGDHHNQVSAVSNLTDQSKNAVSILKPVVEMFDKFYSIRGTEVHGGIGEQQTELIAQALGAEKESETGNYSRQELWLEVGGVITQFAHHIGMTSSAAYETSAPMRELVATLLEAAQWGRPLPHIVFRSHRHRYTRVPIPTEKGDIELVVTPCWQLKTPHVWRVDRMRMPHIGIVLALIEDETWQIKRKLYKLPQPEIVKI